MNNCDKIPYKTIKEAQEAANGMMRWQKTKYRAYQCMICQNKVFHLTSIKVKKLEPHKKLKYRYEHFKNTFNKKKKR